LINSAIESTFFLEVLYQITQQVSLGKTLNAVSHFGAKQSTRCGGPAWRKTCKRSSFCVGVV